MSDIAYKDGWKVGIADAIKIVKARLAHYEMYRCDCSRHSTEVQHRPGCKAEMMSTHPATFAVLDEMLVFLEAMLERGTYKSTSDQMEVP